MQQQVSLAPPPGCLKDQAEGGSSTGLAAFQSLVTKQLLFTGVQCGEQKLTTGQNCVLCSMDLDPGHASYCTYIKEMSLY